MKIISGMIIFFVNLLGTLQILSAICPHSDLWPDKEICSARIWCQKILSLLFHRHLRQTSETAPPASSVALQRHR